MGRDFPGGPVVKNPPSNAGDEVWCLVKKLRSHMPAWLLKSLQSCTILFDPLDCSLPFFSVHGVLTARLLEWVAMPFCRGSSWPRDRSCVSYVSCIGRQVLDHKCHLESPLVSLADLLLLDFQCLENYYFTYMPRFIVFMHEEKSFLWNSFLTWSINSVELFSCSY